MIVGVTGWFAAGKDSVADYLIKKGSNTFHSQILFVKN